MDCTINNHLPVCPDHLHQGYSLKLQKKEVIQVCNEMDMISLTGARSFPNECMDQMDDLSSFCQKKSLITTYNLFSVSRLIKMKSTEVDPGLFTDSYCKVCSAQLISESQRVAHYESRKHANKVRLYYMLHPVDGGCPAKKLRTDNGSAEGDVDKNKCCTLCNMSFTSAVVAQSHYQGKIHAKRLRLLLGEPPAITSKGLKRSHTCEVCSVTLNSVAQYHAHLQGSKHQNNLKNK
ncbi:zinc finger matrin-type protein 4-like isoform X5 [Onychostoma macrolepis]|uniref:zinc finger matrin-type protein 4-like isoform X5 n=1 Tax=Onychostoma macrolepis TaxID=369639 RepID=UPI00272CE6F0|nr:zinc finger matrin-type protein 4-like isoform X5 [Onychostoma macrolepis]